MRPDLILEARAFVRGDFQDVEIGLDLESGRILAVKKDLPGSPRRRHRGRLLVPSGVDLHVHFRDPGAPGKEDFRSGTAGAALGGIGTVVDMPNTDPLVDRVGRFEDKRERVASKALVDWGLWATMTPSTPDPLALLRGAAGLKLYLAPTTGIPDPGTANELRTRLEAARRADRLAILHAETVSPAPPRNLAEHHALRSPEGEVDAVRRVATVAAPLAAVHVAHASTVGTLDAAIGARFSVGVTPHHLLLSQANSPPGGAGKVNPPLRTDAERIALWDAFARGAPVLLESDHAPHTQEEKSRPFPEAPAGVPGVETMYPLLLFEAQRQKVPVARVIEALSERPAARMGLSKGQIEAGFDADFFFFDPHASFPVRGVQLASKCGWTPFEGWNSFLVETHYLHGEIAVDDHRLVARPGSGRALRFGPPGPAPELAVMEAAPNPPVKEGASGEGAPSRR